ncbi:hypothetical protein GA0074692_2035 [Micromonospora pallida]|uniref:Uncharacterized protein n=1 Tax=Micromonospora pallida TaxID=145854 RepID=A0A1C6S8N0_9ACTN|nr:hypothetical protein GA0074692_2035 [Micromonospora pallida]
MHQAARRYLIQRYDTLTGAYAKLPNQGRAADGYHYTDDARRVFPRYRAVEAFLEQVERLDPDRLPDWSNLTIALLRSAYDARSPFTDGQDQVGAEVIRDERRRFASVIRSWSAGGEPLGYRRVLTDEESADWRRRLQRRWALTDVWHPLLPDPVPSDVLVLQEPCMWEEHGSARVRQALRDVGTGRVVELRESGPDYLLDLDLVTTRYNGAEGVWSDDSLTWIAYASQKGP